MIFAGIDIGSRASKAIIMNDCEIIGSTIQDTGPESVKTAYAAIEAAMKEPGLNLDDIDYTVATGYGRVLVPFAKENVSEISCHARGINWYYPSVRTILDMGGQDCKAINCNEEGRVTNFVMNDKCAGGTGRFLEMIADVLDVPLEEIGELALKSSSEIPFNTICAVFAKSEAIVHLRHGVPRSDILAGLNEAISVRCHNLLKKITIESDFTITGGIAKNPGMVDKITRKMGIKPLLAEDPQLIGALGAAIYASEKYQGKATGSDTRIQYGYNDATGDYYITIDSGKCDNCGECLSACPASIYKIDRDENGKSVVMVKELARKKLAILCPGSGTCNGVVNGNCQAVCPENAISLSW